MQNSALELLELTATAPNPTPSHPHASKRPATRAESNRINAQSSTGPRTADGKTRASANSLKHGFFAATGHLDPHDAPAYQTALANLTTGMQPANPAEQQTIRELATFRARLLRLQSIEHVLLCSDIEPANSAPNDPSEFEVTAAFLNNEAQLTRLSRAEAHLQRAYNRTWDRLLRLQKDRRQASAELPQPSATKRTHPEPTPTKQTTTTTNSHAPAPSNGEELTLAQLRAKQNAQWQAMQSRIAAERTQKSA